MQHKFDSSILRQYDIRGVIGKTLTETDCYFVGRSFGTFLVQNGGKEVAIGYDGRETSPTFTDEVIKGLLDCGINVSNMGLVPTPEVYFAVQELGLDAGVIITGSHLALKYNGIKMVLKDDPFYGQSITNLGVIAEKGDFATGKGAVKKIDMNDAYVERLAHDFTGKRKLKIAWDNGNGSGGEVLRRLVKKLPGEHVVLFDEIDGTYPNHHGDPSVAENMQDLIKAVRDNKCDIGVAFDGDADRVGVVDEKGEIIWADTLVGIYASDVLKDRPGAPIVFDVKCSRLLGDEIERLGGKPEVWTTGAATLRPRMKVINSPLGGELSGHVVFADKYYGFDDGIYCAIRILDILAKGDKPMSHYAAHLPKMHSTPEVRLQVNEERKFDVPGEIEKRLKALGDKSIAINDIDGIRVTTPEGWFLIRASNTEDMLTLRAEAFDIAGLEKLKQTMVSQLALSGVELKF